MNSALLDIQHLPALQQPTWDDPGRVDNVRAKLSASPALVNLDDVTTLRSMLTKVAAGEAMVIQAGDCAEDPAECTPADVSRKAGLLDLLAGSLMMSTRKPVLRAGRIAGQFTKPRSLPSERFGGRDLHAYRGHMINRPEPDPEFRRLDPDRILLGYQASKDILGHLGWGDQRRDVISAPVWTSHEALLLDYEVPMLRRDDAGQLWLSSTHWPWIGDRTRQVDGAHVALLAEVVNPVACKVGPRMTSSELLTLCERLDPGRDPGRLTLIARMGTEKIADLLPPLVDAVRRAGFTPIWLCDPMHANTVRTESGLKTRHVQTILGEVALFQTAVRSADGVAGGLHLETTPDEVTECVRNADENVHVGDFYTSLCDPRLNPNQALSVVSAWLG